MRCHDEPPVHGELSKNTSPTPPNAPHGNCNRRRICELFTLCNVHNVMRLAKHAGKLTDGLIATVHETVCVLMVGTR
eukprot:9041191-Alexandrium_andersonii.AAC.1